MLVLKCFINFVWIFLFGTNEIHMFQTCRTIVTTASHISHGALCFGKTFEIRNLRDGFLKTWANKTTTICMDWLNRPFNHQSVMFIAFQELFCDKCDG